MSFLSRTGFASLPGSSCPSSQCLHGEAALKYLVIPYLVPRFSLLPLDKPSPLPTLTPTPSLLCEWHLHPNLCPSHRVPSGKAFCLLTPSIAVPAPNKGRCLLPCNVRATLHYTLLSFPHVAVITCLYSVFLLDSKPLKERDDMPSTLPLSIGAKKSCCIKA